MRVVYGKITELFAPCQSIFGYNVVDDSYNQHLPYINSSFIKRESYRGEKR